MCVCVVWVCVVRVLCVRERQREEIGLSLFKQAPTLENQSQGKPFKSFWFLLINFQTFGGHQKGLLGATLLPSFSWSLSLKQI